MSPDRCGSPTDASARQVESQLEPGRFAQSSPWFFLVFGPAGSLGREEVRTQVRERKGVGGQTRGGGQTAHRGEKRGRASRSFNPQGGAGVFIILCMRDRGAQGRRDDGSQERAVGSCVGGGGPSPF